jgi:hypothetical protein
MQAVHHYILEVKDPYKDEIEVGEIKLFIDKDILRDRSVNRFGKIINVPIKGKDTVLPIGYEVIFDATILYQQRYKEGVQDSIFLVDKDKSWFKILPEMIVLFRENDKSEWKGFKDNLMVAFIKNKPVLKGDILIQPESEYVKGKAIVKYVNDFLEEQEVKNNQEIFINPRAGIPFYFKNETLQWIRSKDVLAV